MFFNTRGEVEAFLQGNPAITQLAVEGGPELRNLPEFPQSLEILVLACCPALEAWPYLPNRLKTLYVRDCPNIKTPPPYTGIYAVKMGPFDGYLPPLPDSLRTLTLIDLPGIQCMPAFPQGLVSAEIYGLPGIRRLPAVNQKLRFLKIGRCPNLPASELRLGDLVIEICDRGI